MSTRNSHRDPDHSSRTLHHPQSRWVDFGNQLLSVCLRRRHWICTGTRQTLLRTVNRTRTGKGAMCWVYSIRLKTRVRLGPNHKNSSPNFMATAITNYAHGTLTLTLTMNCMQSICLIVLSIVERYTFTAYVGMLPYWSFDWNVRTLSALRA